MLEMILIKLKLLPDLGTYISSYTYIILYHLKNLVLITDIAKPTKSI